MSFSDTVDQVKKWCLGVNNLQEAQEGIRRDQLLQQGLKTWSKRLGKVALGLAAVVVILRSGVFLFPAAIAGAAYGAVKLASYLVDRDIKHKQEAAAQMGTAQDNAPAQKPTRQPAPTLKAKVTGAFNARTTPANDTATTAAADSKPASFLKRFGLGK